MSSHSPCARDGGQGPVVCETSHDGAGDGLSTSVLMALNSLPDFDAESSDETLFDRIDPDALDALFRSNGAVEREEGQIRFPIDDYEVVVEANGDIVIRARRSA